jgi:chromosomal replication initiation ATPase DnaA
MRLTPIDKEARQWVVENFGDVDAGTAVMLYDTFKAGYKHKVINEQNKYSMNSIYDMVIYTVCEYYNTTYENINTPGQKREVVQVRQICMYFGCQFTNLSLVAIGEPFDKDHATVLHSKKTISNLIDTNNNVRYDVEVIKKQIMTNINK